MKYYLYGASVKGIQEYIFETNKLKEIIGGSEIIKNFETKFYNKVVNKNGCKILVNAAGNMKAVVNEKVAKDLVETFIYKIKSEAYGIEIVQSLIEIKDENPTKEDFNKLEENLRIQRNIPEVPFDYSFSIVKKSRKTAKSAITKNNEFLDKSSLQKINAYKEFVKRNPKEREFKEFKDISNSKNKIAIVHIDGNGLGEIVLQLGSKISEFSKDLNKITIECFKKAKKEVKSGKIRKIILGGDDVTIVVDATYALSFTEKFIKCFEQNTQQKFGKKLTACAGISYINEKYPFYYAVNLAEELISEAKNFSKKYKQEKNLNEIPSSVMFYSIQSGNFYDLEILRKNELNVNNYSFEFGPYFINEKLHMPTLSELLQAVEYLNDENSPSSKFREWLKIIKFNDVYASRILERIKSISSSKWKYYSSFEQIMEKWGCKNLFKDNVTPIYDILQIKSIME